MRRYTVARRGLDSSQYQNNIVQANTSQNLVLYRIAQGLRDPLSSPIDSVCEIAICDSPVALIVPKSEEIWDALHRELQVRLVAVQVEPRLSRNRAGDSADKTL